MTASQLTAAREALHLSQIDLARALGVAANTVNRWEAGTRKIPPYLLLALDGLQHRRFCEEGEASDEYILDSLSYQT